MIPNVDKPTMAFDSDVAYKKYELVMPGWWHDIHATLMSELTAGNGV